MWIITWSATYSSRLRLKCHSTRAETRFRLSAKRTSPFKLAGVLVQSTTGSRGVRISGSNAGYTMFQGSVKGTGYPHHSPFATSLPLSCVTVCHHISTGLYLYCVCSWTLSLQFIDFPSLIFTYKCNVKTYWIFGFRCCLYCFFFEASRPALQSTQTPTGAPDAVFPGASDYSPLSQCQG